MPTSESLTCQFRFALGQTVLLTDHGITATISRRSEEIGHQHTYHVTASHPNSRFSGPYLDCELQEISGRVCKPIPQPDGHYGEMTITPIAPKASDDTGDTELRKQAATPFKFHLNQAVTIGISGESGTVRARAEYSCAANNYLVFYKCADGRAVENWFTQDQLIATMLA